MSKKTIDFTKMHGLGNDFILIDAINQRIDEAWMQAESANLCDRNFGIGADGVILVLDSEQFDFKMRIFNSDGSEPQMCGNGIRCFAKFVFEAGLIDKDIFSIETLAGPIVPALVLKNNQVQAIEVDMGPAILERGKIPVAGGNPTAQVISEPVEVDGQTYAVTAVSMGNPHAVIFVPDLTEINLEEIGPKFEHHALFPERINTEFVQIVNKSEAIMVVWERGAGETLACGTGACAVVVAGVLTGQLDRKVLVHLPGGDLSIEWQENDGHVMMTGPAQSVFSGKVLV